VHGALLGKLRLESRRLYRCAVSPMEHERLVMKLANNAGDWAWSWWNKRERTEGNTGVVQQRAARFLSMNGAGERIKNLAKQPISRFALDRRNFHPDGFEPRFGLRYAKPTGTASDS
jgi:hypothetical protein